MQNIFGGPWSSVDGSYAVSIAIALAGILAAFRASAIFTLPFVALAVSVYAIGVRYLRSREVVTADASELSVIVDRARSELSAGVPLRRALRPEGARASGSISKALALASDRCGLGEHFGAALSRSIKECSAGPSGMPPRIADCLYCIASGAESGDEDVKTVDLCVAKLDEIRSRSLAARSQRIQNYAPLRLLFTVVLPALSVFLFVGSSLFFYSAAAVMSLSVALTVAMPTMACLTEVGLYGISQ